MRNSSFPHAVRICHAADFSAMNREGAYRRSQYFTLKYRPNGLGYARLGLAISRRTSKHAIERNRIKRLVRESFRHKRHQLPSLDFLVMGQCRACSQTGTVLLAELDILWRKLSASGVIDKPVVS